MRLVVQRVNKANVTVNKQNVAQIKKGLLVFFGLHKNDTEKQIPFLANKLVNLRIFEDEKNKMNLSVLDIKGEILLVPQFTLYGDCMKGRRPSFTETMQPHIAKVFFENFIEQVKKLTPKVQTGIFGAVMEIELINFGPVTFIIEV